MVATLGETKDFPSFYSRKSNCEAPYNVKDPLEAAKVISACRELNMKSGCLFAVPVPEEHALEDIQVDIEEALREAERKRVKGKEITPYLLSFLFERTGGRTLKSSIL